MPRGPKGEKRPAEVIGNAVHVMKIATGKIEEVIQDDGNDKAAQALAQRAARHGRRRDARTTGAELLRKQLKKRWGR